MYTCCAARRLRRDELVVMALVLSSSTADADGRLARLAVESQLVVVCATHATLYDGASGRHCGARVPTVGGGGSLCVVGGARRRVATLCFG